MTTAGDSGQSGVTGAMPLAQVASYKLPDGATLELLSRRDGTAHWAVRKMCMCLNAAGDWEDEPSPSNRDDAFFARCRWPSPQEAYAVWASAASREYLHG